MYYDSICLEGDHALLYEMSYGRSCIGGVHQDGIFYNILSFTERHVLLEVMFT